MRRAPGSREKRPASANAAQPERTGASRLATLNDATGPKRSVMGDSTAAGASQLVLAMALTPPRRDHMALVRNGSGPWVTAQGSHSSHHTCCTVSPQLQVMAWAGLPPNQTWPQKTRATARYVAIARR